MALRLQTPIPTKVTCAPERVQIVLALVVVKTMGWPEAPPVAVSVAAAAPKTTGVVGKKPVIVCEVKSSLRMVPVALEGDPTV